MDNEYDMEAVTTEEKSLSSPIREATLPIVCSPKQCDGRKKGKRIQLQSPPVSNRTCANQTANLLSTPELVARHYEGGSKVNIKTFGQENEVILGARFPAKKNDVTLDELIQNMVSESKTDLSHVEGTNDDSLNP